MSIKFVPYTITDDSLTVWVNHKPIVLTKDRKEFSQAIDCVKNKNWEKLAEIADLSTKIVKHFNGSVEIRNGMVHMDGEPMPKAISDRVILFSEEGIDYTYLTKFWENLKQNPSYRARNDLFAFLEKNGHPITENGCFVAYKKIRFNFTDSHTGTFDNSIGTIVKMDRKDVDDNPERTCSAGLHVANFNYAQHFSGQILVSCEVNPRDVVSIPLDYNGEKMRVCEYKVLEVIEQEYTKPVYVVNPASVKSVQPIDWKNKDLSYGKAEAVRKFALTSSLCHREIGNLFNLTKSQVCHILRNSTWTK
jgi:hypothetical protein